MASADKQFNIFKEFGEEKQPLPYATLVYIEQNRGLVFNRSKALAFAGYCDPSVTWTDNTSVEISCTTTDDYIRYSNNFGVAVEYKIKQNVH